MPDLVLLHHTLYQIRNKLQATIRNNFSRHTKSSKYFSKNKINNNYFNSKINKFSLYPFVTKSIQTKICFLFDDVRFIGPTKSIAHFSKGSIITWGHKGISLVWMVWPTRWHLSHHLKCFLASLNKEAKKYLACKIFMHFSYQQNDLCKVPHEKILRFQTLLPLLHTYR